MTYLGFDMNIKQYNYGYNSGIYQSVRSICGYFDAPGIFSFLYHDITGGKCKLYH